MAKNVNRRNVLKGLGGFAVVSAVGGRLGSAVASSGNYSNIDKVENRAVQVPNNAFNHKVYGYAKKSVAAGENIAFHIKSDTPFQLSIVRPGWDKDQPGPLDWTLQVFPLQPSSADQFIFPGSYIHVERALVRDGQYSQLTLECWVRLFNKSGWRGLITQYSHSEDCGYGLFIDNEGKPHLYFGNGGAYNPVWDLAGQSSLIPAIPTDPPYAWHHLAAVFDAGTAKLYVDGVLEAQSAGFPLAVTPGDAPLRIGAYGFNASTDNFLDGDIAMPIIYGGALTAQQIGVRATVRPPQSPEGQPYPPILGCWPLAEETGQVVNDIGDDCRTGIIVNHGTWVIGGPGFDALSIGRFEQGHDPVGDQRGHGLRLSSGDLLDCDWPETHSYVVPEDAVPGIYVGRVSNSSGEKIYDITFVVKPAVKIKRDAPVLVVCSTSTWLAYNQEFNLFGQYKNHESGQYAYHAGLNMPWSAADPYALYYEMPSLPDPNNPGAPTDPFGYKYSHLVRVERFLHDWMEQTGVGYDVVGDHDIDTDPALLDGYKVIAVVGHSEYWTASACLALKNHIVSGGKLVSLSGNTMCWRVTYRDEVFECRRKIPTPLGEGNEMYGEQYHEHDRASGGSLREAGIPAWQITGLETIAYDDGFFSYQATQPQHLFYLSPEQISLPPNMQLGGNYAVGHEYDIVLQGIPAIGREIDRPPVPIMYNPTVIAQASHSFRRLDYGLEREPSTTFGPISQIIDWEVDGGGRVFSIGSVNAARALYDDPNMAKLFRNALHYLGLTQKLNILAVGQDGTIRNKWYDGQDWLPSAAGWESLGDAFGADSLVGLQGSPSTASIMIISSSGTFMYRYWSDAWSDWQAFSNPVGFQGKPAAASSGRDRLHLFARGTDERIYWKHWNGSDWQGWIDLGGAAVSDPSAVIWQGRNPSVAYLLSTGSVEYRFWNGSGWSDAFDMGGSFAHGPVMHWWGGRLYVFAVNSAGAVSVKYWTGNAWTSWIEIGGTMSGCVQVAPLSPSELCVFGIDTAAKCQMAIMPVALTSSQNAWIDLGGNFAGNLSVTSHRGSCIQIVGRSPGGDVYHAVLEDIAFGPANVPSVVWSGWQAMGGAIKGSPMIFRSIAL